MGQQPLEAIITKRNQVVQAALRCVDCNTIVKIARFPEATAAFAMRDYINRQNETVAIWHFCLPNTRKPMMHGSAHAGLFA